jgi:hypothetical protein
MLKALAVALAMSTSAIGGVVASHFAEPGLAPRSGVPLSQRAVGVWPVSDYVEDYEVSAITDFIIFTEDE